MTPGENSLQPSLIAIAVGNTRARIGAFVATDLNASQSLPAEDAAAVAHAVAELVDKNRDVPIVISSVNGASARAISQAILDRSGISALFINSDILVPMAHALDDASTLGQDRILCAYAAFCRVKQACVVVDVGTAITVDFVDGEGTFQGGAIAPGVTMMLRALHERTAALPLLEATIPDAARGVFGKDTRHAMLLGARAAVIGMVRYLIDQYADSYGAYPQVIATGGDAASLFEDEPLVEHIVPDLQLVGILEAVKANDAQSHETP